VVAEKWELAEETYQQAQLIKNLRGENQKLCEELKEQVEDLNAIVDHIKRQRDNLLNECCTSDEKIANLEFEKDELQKEMTSLREDAKYAVRTHSTPVKTNNISSCSYDNVINSLKNFDITSLRHGSASAKFTSDLFNTQNHTSKDKIYTNILGSRFRNEEPIYNTEDDESSESSDSDESSDYEETIISMPPWVGLKYE
jgi:hypothetical protein